MTRDHFAQLAQLDALKSADVGAVFAELIRAGLQALIAAEATEATEATEAIGAGRYQRSDGGSVHRNGHRPKTVLRFVKYLAPSRVTNTGPTSFEG